MKFSTLMAGGALALAMTGGASAATVVLDNGPASGSISTFGSPDSLTYGEVLTAPLNGRLTDFTLTLNGGVGSLQGGVGTWNGGATYATGFGSPSTLWLSSAVASTGAASYSFHPNVGVSFGQQIVVFLSAYGNAATTGTTDAATSTNPVVGVDYFVWNNTSSPYGNGSWNYFADFGNLEVQATFQSGAPEPAAWALMLVGFGGLGVALRSRRRAAIAA